MFEKPNTGVCVDGSTLGNPGVSQFKSIDIQTCEILFLSPKFYATNNVCEFLGLINSIHYCLKNNKPVVYTDSQTAIAWVKSRKVKTGMIHNKAGQETWNRVNEALKWLETMQYDSFNDVLIDPKSGKTVVIKKWITSEWGENPADFGNK